MRNIGGSLEFEKWCKQLFDTIIKGNVNIRIHHMYSLSEIVRVHEDLEGRRTTGKVLVKL
jgi:NADPH2:quinone reductase